MNMKLSLVIFIFIFVIDGWIYDYKKMNDPRQSLVAKKSGKVSFTDPFASYTLKEEKASLESKFCYVF